MGIGAITIPAAGNPTAPAAMAIPDTMSPIVAAVVRYAGPYPWRFAYDSGSRMALAFNAVGPVLNLIGSTVVRTGLLAPYAALTVAGTGTKATAVLTTTGNFTALDYFTLVHGSATYPFWPIIVVAAFSPTYAHLWQVLLEASASATLDNIVTMVMGTGTDGVKFRSPTVDSGRDTKDHPATWSDWVTAVKTSAAVVTFTAKRAGTVANTWSSAQVVDAGGTYSFGAATFTGGAAGSGTAPNYPSDGLFFYGFGYYRTIDRALSGISPVAQFEQDDHGETDLSVMADPPANQKEDIDTKVWYRSLGNGDADVLYEGYRVAVADTTDDDNLEDDEIAEHALYDPSIYRSWADGFVSRRRCVAPLKERMVAAGHIPMADYSFGVASVTAASNEVTLSASGTVTPLPTKRMEGRTFRVTTSALTEATVYRIIYVNESTFRLYLDRAYEGSTDAAAAYTVSDRTDAFESVYCESGLPNNWPARNSLGGPVSRDPAGVTAMLSAFESVLEWTGTGLWRLTGTDRFSFRITNVGEECGCVGPEAATEAEGYVYWVAQDGIYRWGGSGRPQCISSVRTRRGDLVGVRETFARVNQSWIKYAVAVYCPGTRVVRFFLPLDDEVTNRWALVYDVQTETWALDQYGFDVCSAAVVADGTSLKRTLVGTLHGDIIELDVGESDCAYGFEPVAAITSSTVRTATCSGASFPTSGSALAGLPVMFVDASGNFTYNTIGSNTGTVLTFTRPMAAAPTGTLIVGGIHAILESGRFALGDPAHLKGMPFVRLFFETGADGTLYLSVAGDQDDPAVVDAAGYDLSSSDGEAEACPMVEGRWLKFRLDVFEPGTSVRLLAPRIETAGGGASSV